MTLGINNPYRDLFVTGNGLDNFQLRKLSIGHFHMNFVDRELRELRKQRRIGTSSHRMAFVIPKTEVCRETATPRDRLNCPIKNIHQPGSVFSRPITAHGWLVHGKLLAPCLYQVLQLAADDW